MVALHQNFNPISEARLAKDSDKIAEVNSHVWDSVDRIYLCKLSPIPVRRKRCKQQAQKKKKSLIINIIIDTTIITHMQ